MGVEPTIFAVTGQRVAVPLQPHKIGTRGGTWTHNLLRATASKAVTYAFRHSGV